MNRRLFIALTGGVATLGGCSAIASRQGRTDGSGQVTGTTTDETPRTTAQDTETHTDEGPPETEQDEITGPADQPITDYQLDVREERWGAHPIWIDQDQYLYGRGSNRLLGSDDWWQTNETRFTFDGKVNVRAVVVPESGRVIVSDSTRSDGFMIDATVPAFWE